MKPDDIQTAHDFAFELARLRDNSGLTYADIRDQAESMGVALHPATVANMVKGHTIPRPNYLHAFLNCVGIEDEDSIEAWMHARERVWKPRNGDNPFPRHPGGELRRIEEAVTALRETVARIEGMLLARGKE